MQPWRGEPARILVEQLLGELVCSGGGGRVGHPVLESRTLGIAVVLAVFATTLRRCWGTQRT